MTEIILQKGDMTGGETRFDLIMKGTPRNFLGLAADINFEGDLAVADFNGMKWGGVFQGLAQTDKPIELVRVLPDRQKLVLGITLKASNLPHLEDGKLATLVFKNKITPIAFENQVLSVFENGRRDLSDTVWTVKGGQVQAEIPLPIAKSSQLTDLSVPDKALLQNTMEVPNSTTAEFTASINEAAVMEVLNAPAGSQGESLWGWWWLILMLFSVLPVLLLILAWANRKNKAGPGRALGALPKQIELDY